ncbi:MAG: NPCBM/NEW2 domain-containing protein [Ruminococcus sp.]|nr:NPCBM/NEW2 domain-containing protein [Ruminococcus sp.]
MEDDAIADALEEAEIYAESKNYESAIAVLEKALNSYSGDASLQAAYDTYTDEFVNYVIAEANSLISENDYSSAITKLEAAVKVVDSDTLTDMLAQTKENQPVNLTELKSQNADDFWIESSAVEDVFGNIYSGKNVWEIGGGVPNSCEFYTGENYTTITGTIIPQTNFNSAVAINFEIYVDGELKYSQKVTQKMEPTSFEVDVTGGKWVKIKVSEIEGTKSYYYSGGSYHNTVILYNPVLTK